MKLRITGFVRDFARIYRRGKISVNEQLRLNNPAIKVEFWQIIQSHRVLMRENKQRLAAGQAATDSEKWGLGSALREQVTMGLRRVLAGTITPQYAAVFIHLSAL